MHNFFHYISLYTLVMGRVTDPEKTRLYWYIAMLYPEDESTQVYHNAITNATGVQWLRILHDKDSRETENGIVMDKPHYHYLIHLPTAKTYSAFLKFFHIREEDARKFRKLREDNPDEESGVEDPIAFQKYLVHQTYQAKKEGKYQYDPKSVEGNMLDEFYKALDNYTNDSEDIQILNILDWLDSTTEFVSTSELTRVCVKNGWWSTLRRSGNIGMRILDEHNNKIANIRTLQNYESDFIERKENEYARFEEQQVRIERKSIEQLKLDYPNRSFNQDGYANPKFQEIKQYGKDYIPPLDYYQVIFEKDGKTSTIPFE